MGTVVMDLDQLIPDEKTVIWKKQEHVVRYTSAEMFLNLIKYQKKLGTMDDEDQEKQTQVTVEFIHMAVPTIPRNDLLTLPIAVLMRLAKLIEQEMEAGMGEGESEQEVGESTLAALSPA